MIFPATLSKFETKNSGISWPTCKELGYQRHETRGDIQRYNCHFVAIEPVDQTIVPIAKRTAFIAFYETPNS